MSKSSNWKLFVIIFVNLSLVLLLLFNPFAKKETVKVKLGQGVLNLEISDTLEKRTKGLMFRNTMGGNNGMFFVFDYADYQAFWMKNTLLPLDIIWLDADAKVLGVKKNAIPCKELDRTQENCPLYRSYERAKYVLEVNAGWFDKNNIEIKDSLTFLD